ncbi:MAG TPA: zinc dependent phospholipase C family protein [Terriglobales bacterium]|jgi:hypothetical protein|nr:zinc dependent phospholipase C family protein [Terriglobales bacterium]
MYRRSLAALLLCVLCLGVVCPPAAAYSVLSHEQVIDMAWNDSIAPLLRARFPHATPDEIKAAEAYAFGGCVIQDLGYYPFGSPFFSDLVHYVRSGDFVVALLKDAQTLNEYAFAVGALAHYVSDIHGHPTVNRAVALEYPKLRRRFGDVITYDQAKSAHLETEFGFDVLQVAKARYAPKQYHDFIGFEVAEELLERAFRETYGLELKDVMTHQGLAVATYRHAVSQTIPHLTQVALATRKPQMMHEFKDFDEKKFLYNLSRADYEKEWGTKYQKPGLGAKILAFFVRLVPKIGPFRAAKYRDPTAVTENMYFESMNTTLDHFRARLAELRKGVPITLADYDCDTGALARPGEYARTDRVYDKLLRTLNEQRFRTLDAPLRADLLSFFAQRTPKDKDTREALARLRQTPAAGAPAIAAEAVKE